MPEEAMEDFANILDLCWYCSRKRRSFSPMLTTFTQFLRDESGATAIEYGLIAAGIAVAIIVTVKGIGPKLNTTFTSISSQLK
jgi:pilus assembly protein Flp/PilA